MFGEVLFGFLEGAGFEGEFVADFGEGGEGVGFFDFDDGFVGFDFFELGGDVGEFFLDFFHLDVVVVGAALLLGGVGLREKVLEFFFVLGTLGFEGFKLVIDVFDGGFEVVNLLLEFLGLSEFKFFGDELVLVHFHFHLVADGLVFLESFVVVIRLLFKLFDNIALLFKLKKHLPVFCVLEQDTFGVVLESTS